MKRSYFFGPLPIARWPAIDQAAWERARGGDALSEDGAGAAAHWRQSTAGIVATQYGVWLAWLQSRRKLHGEVDPGRRASLVNVREYLRDMRFSGLSEHSCSARLTGLGAALRVMSPDSDTRFITRAAGRISAKAHKKRGFLVHQVSIEDLVSLASRLIAQADDPQLSGVERALSSRDGLALLLLIHRPLRIRNAAAIDLRRHLVRTRVGYRLEFQADEMKGNLPYSCTLPAQLHPLLDRYLEEFRPVLLAGRRACSALWITIHGEPLSKPGLTGALHRRTEEAFGRRLGPHMIRHIVTTAIAERLPSEVEDLTVAALSHQNLAMSERHYNHATGYAATVLLQEAVAARTSVRVGKRTPRQRQS